MTEAQVKEAAKNYVKKFTSEQIDQMEKRTFQRIMNGNSFDFGPKGSQFHVKFVRNNRFINLITNDNKIILNSWPKYCNAKQITEQLFEMCALWDIVEKNYYIDLSKQQGYEA